MKKLFKQITSVTHQGITITFARIDKAGNYDIYYNILDLKADSVNDKVDWTGFRKLEMPSQLRQVGMSLIDIDISDTKVTHVSDTPFKVVSDKTNVCVFQQSSRGTLLLNRFMLKNESSKENHTTLVLEPLWEVRYKGSGKQDIPADAKDVQNYANIFGKPFIEPILELGMINEVVEGRFDVMLIPNSESGSYNWQFFIYNNVICKMDLFSFPMDENGLFDLTEKSLNKDSKISPDASFRLIEPNAGKPIELKFKYAPSAQLYYKQERIFSKSGESKLLERNARVMLALAVQKEAGKADPVNVATIDFGVSKAGRLSGIEAETEVPQIKSADYTLQFYNNSYVELSNNKSSLSIKQSFELSAWIYPKNNSGKELLILGGDPSVDIKNQAPYLKLIDGAMIKAGFGDGTTASSCTSVNSVIEPEKWTHVSVTYHHTKGEYEMKINSESAEVVTNGGNLIPSGTPISQISADENGFTGNIDLVRIYTLDSKNSKRTKKGEWKFDKVDYSVTPPITPDSSPNKNNGSLYGPKQVPSNNPVEGSTSGNLYIDDHGMSTYAGLLDFIHPKSSPFLSYGSDGYIHLYFQSSENKENGILDNSFSVAIYDVEASRSIFGVDWIAKVDEKKKGENGFVQLVSRKSGIYMNAASIKVEVGDEKQLLNISIDDKKGHKETWLGVPASQDQFIDVLNGKFTFDPNDPQIATGKKVFFDVYGKYPSCRVPTASDSEDSALVFLSRLANQIPLHSVQLSDKKDGKIKAILGFKPAKWNKKKEVIIQQTWNEVPAEASLFVETLNGTNPNYDYSSTESVNTSIYNLEATPPADEQNSIVQVVTKPETTDFSIAVKNASNQQSDQCDVDIKLDVETELMATWKNVPRDQNTFALILNYEANEKVYDYKKNATGSYQQIGEAILVLTDSLSAHVGNHNPKKANLSDMLAITATFQLYLEHTLFSNTQVDDYPLVNAKILQTGSYKSTSSKHVFLTGGSTLFGAVAGTNPTKGGIALVQPTTPFTNGTANLLVNGVNSGWINESPRFGLKFDDKNYISYDIANPGIDKLAMPDDMSMELWVKPDLIAKPKDSNQQLITYNTDGTLSNPKRSTQYMLGLKRSYCLDFDKNTSLSADPINNNPLDEVTIQCWANFKSPEPGQVLAIGYNIGRKEQPIRNYLEITWKDGFAWLWYNGHGLPTKKEVEINRWTNITGRIKRNPSDPNQIDVALYLDGELQSQVTKQKNEFPDTYTHYLFAGSPTPDTSPSAQMQVNDAAYWDRALGDSEIKQSIGVDILDRLKGGLQIYFPLTQSKGTNVSNEAPNNKEVIAILSSGRWAKEGVRLNPYYGNRENLYSPKKTINPTSWHHLSAVYQAGYSLNFNGNDFVQSDYNNSLDVEDEFSLDFWITPKKGNKEQVLFSKKDTYEVRISQDNRLVFECITNKGKKMVTSTETKLEIGKPYYVAVSIDIAGYLDNTDKIPNRKYQLMLRLMIDTTDHYFKEIFDEKIDGSPQIENNENPFYIGTNHPQGESFTGEISDVRLWEKFPHINEVDFAFRMHHPLNEDGLVSSWLFTEEEGKIAYDSEGVNNAFLSSNEMWSRYHSNARVSFYIDGSLTEVYPSGDPNYGKEQFQLASHMDRNDKQLHGFAGELDDLRIWDIPLTQEQITDNMYRVLSGDEKGLAGYWKIDAGSGTVMEDFSGNQNPGTLMPAGSIPKWQNSDAPLNEEAKEVRNVLGGVPTLYQQFITEPPTVTEYADTQKDANGVVFSVMKRCYASVRDGVVQLVTGYKVGDLDTIYAGQVQTKPSLIGFIEGAPPIPSENQTMPFWAGDISERFIYKEDTFTEFQEAKSVVWQYAAANKTDLGLSSKIQGGLSLSTEFDYSVGVGAQVGQQTFELEGKLGFQAEYKARWGQEKNVGFSQGLNKTLSNRLQPGGAWEPAPYLNPQVGRRYITNNQGYALVKSATADLFAITLKGRGSLVKYAVVPNPNIPEDVNILDFPIDPKYVKNGTLDGKVGLKNDPDYPYADEGKGSYFKPLEAYQLKRKIHRQEGQIAAYYCQFNAEKYTSNGLNGKNSGEEKLKAQAVKNQSFDWEEEIPKNNMVNTYVWTSGGGLHKEESSSMDTYSESYGAFRSDSLSAGIHVEMSAASIVGIFGEFDVLFDTNYEGTSTRTKEQSDAFNLECSVHTDAFLKRPNLEDNELLGYDENHAPGKVNAYRFNSFFIAPNQRNFDAFLTQVIDQNWLNNSQMANAVALREATAVSNGVWRIMHRTTFVSRVPASFQPVNDETQSPDITPPANVESNDWLIRIIEKEVNASYGHNPSRLEIGKAIEKTLGKDYENPGALVKVIPWWKHFHKEAEDIQNKAYRTLYELRVDLLNYMVQKYNTMQYEDQTLG